MYYVNTLIDNIIKNIVGVNSCMINHQYFYDKLNNDLNLIITTIEYLYLHKNKSKYVTLKDLCILFSDDRKFDKELPSNITNYLQLSNTIANVINTFYIMCNMEIQMQSLDLLDLQNIKNEYRSSYNISVISESINKELFIYMQELLVNKN